MSLQSLPPELLDMVLSYLSDRQTFTALTLTCRALRPAADDRLYRDVVLQDAASVARVAAALEQRVERSRAVECVDLSLVQVAGEAQRVLDLLNAIKVRVLRVENASVNSGRAMWRTRDHFTGFWWRSWVRQLIRKMQVVGTGVHKPAFDRVTSFTLHSDSDRHTYLDYTVIHPIFMSPTLRFLHVSCVDFLEDPPKTRLPISRTPLRALILERCHASPAILTYLLSLPKSLAHLALGLEPASEYSAPDFSDTLTTLSALLQQSHALKHLRYQCAPSRNISIDLSNLSILSATLSRTSCPGLRPFPHLQTLDIDHRSDLLATLLNPSLAPPVLCDLGIMGMRYGYENTWSNLSSFLAPIIASTASVRTLRMYLNANSSVYHDPWMYDRDREEFEKFFTEWRVRRTDVRAVLERVVQQMKKEDREGKEDIGLEVVAMGYGLDKTSKPANWTGKVVFDSRRAKGEKVDERFEHREYDAGVMGRILDRCWNEGNGDF